MKIYLTLFISLLLLCGSALYPVIEILTPKEKQVFFEGDIVNITFTSIAPNLSYKLTLIKDNLGLKSPTQVLIINGTMNGTEANHQYKIPTSGGSGKYMLIIGCYGRYNVTFYVKEKPGLLTIKIHRKKIRVISPINNAMFKAGQPLRISWDKSFGKYKSVKISLINASTQKEIISKSTGNTGKFIWTLPEAVSRLRSKYFIKIATTDNKYSGTSGTFSLYKKKLELRVLEEKK